MTTGTFGSTGTCRTHSSVEQLERREAMNERNKTTRWLETHRLPVASRSTGGEVAAVELPDHLAAAELVVVVHRHDVVPAALQLIKRGGREAVFNAHVHPLHDAEARTVTCSLGALIVVGDPHHHLHVALGLHGAAHHAEAHHRPAAFRNKAGNDGLVRALAGPYAVGVARLEHEAGAAVLQRDTVHYHARAKARVVRLDERYHHPGGVGCREIYRAAFRRVAVAEILRALQIYELRPRLQVFVVE